MGLDLVHFLLALIVPAVLAVLGLGLVIVVVMKLAIRDGITLQRDETEEEFKERLRQQIQDDRKDLPRPGAAGRADEADGEEGEDGSSPRE
jgi:hypothetical protein